MFSLKSVFLDFKCAILDITKEENFFVEVEMEEERFERIVKQTMKDYPNFTFKIYKSSKSSSKYLIIKDDLEFMKSLRVSDHRNFSSRSFDKEMVAPKIKEKVLKKTIVNLCESLKRKRLGFLLYGVSLKLEQKIFT